MVSRFIFPSIFIIACHNEHIFLTRDVLVLIWLGYSLLRWWGCSASRIYGTFWTTKYQRYIFCYFLINYTTECMIADDICNALCGKGGLPNCYPCNGLHGKLLRPLCCPY